MESRFTRTTRRRILVGLGVALAALAVLRFAWWHEGTPPVAAQREGAWLPRLAWPAGERQVFRLTYRSQDEARPIVEQGATTAAAEPLRSLLDLEAVVAVTGEGAGSGEETMRLRFEVLSCERAAWEIAGGAAWSDAAACSSMLVGSSLGVEVTQAGVTTALYDPPDADTSAQSVLQALWLRLQAALPPEPLAPGGTYWVEEKALQGTAANVYRVSAREGRAGGGFLLERTTRAYLDVRAAQGLRQRPVVDAAGAASFAIDERGLLQSANGDERLGVRTADGMSLLSSQTSFHFEWLRREPAGAPLDFGALAARAPTSALVGADVKAMLLDNRIAGLDLTTLLDTLRRPGAGAQGDARFLWRATGFLEKHPEAASELLALYRSSGASPQLQARVLDLLASVGHEQAQAAMRAALGDPHALLEGDAAARRLYQRLGLLEEPDLRTAEMVSSHYQALRAGGTIDAELTSAYSLGAIVGKLARGDGEARALARSYNAQLASDLRGASDPTELAHRVSALGNARLAENVALFSELAQHESARVRRHVAQALGKAETDAPPAALLALMGDPDPVVQRTAVRGATPDDSVYRRLAQDVSAGRVPQLNVRPILDLVKEGRSGHREATSALLGALLAQGIDDDMDRELALLLDAR